MDFTPSSLPIENEYPKLVRDNIPEIIKQKTGQDIEQRILENDEEYVQYLLKKVIEESIELEHSVEKGNMQEELADVTEVINQIIKLKGYTWQDIVAVQQEKREKNGGFEKRILMLKKV